MRFGILDLLSKIRFWRNDKFVSLEAPQTIADSFSVVLPSVLPIGNSSLTIGVDGQLAYGPLPATLASLPAEIPASRLVGTVAYPILPSDIAKLADITTLIGNHASQTGVGAHLPAGSANALLSYDANGLATTSSALFATDQSAYLLDANDNQVVTFSSPSANVGRIGLRGVAQGGFAKTLTIGVGEAVTGFEHAFTMDQLRITGGRFDFDPLDDKAEFRVLGNNTTFGIFNFSTYRFYAQFFPNGVAQFGRLKLAELNFPPSYAGDDGATGEIRITEDYIYVCTAQNTWKRAQLASW